MIFHNGALCSNNTACTSRIYPTKAPRIHSRLHKCQTGGSSSIDLGSHNNDIIEDVKRFLELVERAENRWDVEVSDFVSPAVVHECNILCKKLSDIKMIQLGGYSSAERCRLAVGRYDIIDNRSEDLVQEYIAAIFVQGSFIFDPATHRDFLGSVLATGVSRSKVGDVIVLGDSGAQFLTTPGLVDHFQTTLKQVRSVPVKCSAIAVDQLRVKPPKMDTFSTVESSTRLDAVASSGFRVSRSKMADMIRNGMVQINFRQVTKASHVLKESDIVTVRGKGRLSIGRISLTRKQRYSIDLIRYA